jgi:hypothetical protein
VKHLPERGGRLRRVPEGASRAPVPRDQRRGHAGRGARVRGALRVDLAVDPRSVPRAR